MAREDTIRRWLAEMIPNALHRGSRGGLRIVLELTPMTDSATGEPSLILNGRPLRPHDIEPFLGRVGTEACAFLDAQRRT